MKFVVICVCAVIWYVFVHFRSKHLKKKSIERRERALKYFRSQESKNEVSNIPDSISFQVKGTNHRSPDEISAARFCNKGDTLILVPEPDNKVDRNAVKVYTIEGFHIGYVEASHAPTISKHIDHIQCCKIQKVSTHEIPYIDASVSFSDDVSSQPSFIPKDFQCSAEQKMQNLKSVPLDKYKYRRVLLIVEGLYELDRATIAKARTAREGDKITLKKGECNEYYPYRLDVFLEDGTYVGYADNLSSGEVYSLFDFIVDSFVDKPISSETSNRLAVSVIFPDELKCPDKFLPSAGISIAYHGAYPEIKTAQELRSINPSAALDILQPIVKREKGIDARIECIACYYHLKDWKARINIINETIQHIESLTEEDLPKENLDWLHRYLPTLKNQLEYSQKRLDAINKKQK